MFLVQKVQYINQIKGRQFVSSEQILNYLANPETPDIHREIFFTFKEHGLFDETQALTIQEIADLMCKDKDYLGIQLGILASIGFLNKTISYKESEVNKRKYKLKSYYLSRQHISPVGRTVLPETVFKKVEPVACETKVTKPKEKKPSGEIQETFDLFNEELVKVLGETKKLKVLNDKRKKDVQKLIDLNLDLRAMFKGFFLDRKELENDHIDFHYILRNPERYLHKGSANKQVDDHLLLKKKQKYLTYIMDGKDPEQFGLKREELGITDQEIQKAKERYEYEKELLG